LSLQELAAELPRAQAQRIFDRLREVRPREAPTK